MNVCSPQFVNGLAKVSKEKFQSRFQPTEVLAYTYPHIRPACKANPILMFTQAQYEQFISVYSGCNLVAEISNVLMPIWVDDYAFTSPSAQIVEVETGESGASFSYLFDLA
jgi:hypothetical protein